MRSTVDIEDRLDKQLRRRASALDITFKEALNRVVAAGLEVLNQSPSSRKPYRVRARFCGIQPGVDYGKLNRMLDELETEEFVQKETVRRRVRNR